MKEISRERLVELLRYEAESGKFFWRTSRQGSRPTLEAGTLDEEGYVHITVEGKNWRAHRLAWLYVYGVPPNGSLDHVDGDKANNQIRNLREASPAENEANKPANRVNRLGVRGVRLTPSGRYRTQIMRNGKSTHIGIFATADEAAAAYRAKALEIFGSFVHETVLTAESDHR